MPPTGLDPKRTYINCVASPCIGRLLPFWIGHLPRGGISLNDIASGNAVPRLRRRRRNLSLSGQDQHLDKRDHGFVAFLKVSASDNEPSSAGCPRPPSVADTMR